MDHLTDIHSADDGFGQRVIVPDGNKSTKPGILVVDDHLVILRMLEVALLYFGWRVWVASTHLEAIEKYSQNCSEIGLVLIDVNMPYVDGPQLLSILRAINPHAVACFMTGTRSCYSKEELLAYGASRVYSKPFDLKPMTQQLEDLVATDPEYLHSKLSHTSL